MSTHYSIGTDPLLQSWVRTIARLKAMHPILTACFLVLSPLGSSARADDNPSAEQVLERANLGRSEFIQVCAEVERFAPILPAKEDLYPYLMVLDGLDELRIRFDMDSFGANPVKHLSSVLTREAVKWLRFDTDSWEFTDTFLRWAPDDVRLNAVNSQSYAIITAQASVEGLMQWNEISGKAIDVLDSVHALPYVLSAYRELQSVVIGKILRIADIADDIAVSVIQGCRTVQGLTEIIQVLEQQVYAESQAVRLQSLVTRGLEAKGALGRMLMPVPAYLHTSIGQIELEALQKLLFSGATVPVAQASEIIAVLAGRQAVDLGVLLGQVGVVGVQSNQLPFLWPLANGLATVFESMNLYRDLLELQRFMGKVKLLMLAGARGYEGSYAVSYGTTSTTLTLANTSGDTFIAGLEVPVHLPSGSAFFGFSFMNIVYDPTNDQFIATRSVTTTDDPSTASADTLIFRIKDGRIKGTYANVHGINQLSGRLITPFGHYAVAATEPTEDLTGIYLGRGDASGSPEFRLDLVQAGSRATGRLFFDGRMMDVQFGNGWINTRNNAVYLTSRELPSGRWIQIRGQIKRGRFVGEYILGGEGRRYGTLRLHKQR